MGQAMREQRPGAGGSAELLRLAWPFILSNSLWTLQIALDRILLSRATTDSVGAVNAAASSFFAGRGASAIVLLINSVGLAVNLPLAYAWINGHWGFPAWGIAGAGWATVAGSSTSALLSLGLMLLPRYQNAFHTASAWRFYRAL